MEVLAKKLTRKTRIFALDLTEEQDLLEQELQRQRAVVRMLINCAGYGIMGHFSEQEENLECGMIRLNCEALTQLTHRLIPYMRPGSRILQLASSAAFLPGPPDSRSTLPVPCNGSAATSPLPATPTNG